MEADGDQRAAAFAYNLLMSIFPLLVLLATLGSLFGERAAVTRAVVESINRYTPLTGNQEHAAEAVLAGLLAARGSAGVTAGILLMFGSLTFLRSLIATTNRIWGSKPYSWWRLPLKSLGLLGIAGSVFLVGILLPTAAQLIRGWFGAELPLPPWAFLVLVHGIPWIVLFYGFLMLYRLAPSRPTRFSDVWIGALAATVVIGIGEELFLLYMVHLARLQMLYGALGVIVALLLWNYLSSVVCVLGICLCAAAADGSGAGGPLVESRAFETTRPADC